MRIASRRRIAAPWDAHRRRDLATSQEPSLVESTTLILAGTRTYACRPAYASLRAFAGATHTCRSEGGSKHRSTTDSQPRDRDKLDECLHRGPYGLHRRRDAPSG